MKSVDLYDIGFGTVLFIVFVALMDLGMATFVVLLWLTVNTVIIKSQLRTGVSRKDGME